MFEVAEGGELRPACPADSLIEWYCRMLMLEVAEYCGVLGLSFTPHPVAGKLPLRANPSGSASTDKKLGPLSRHSERNNSTCNCQ